MTEDRLVAAARAVREYAHAPLTGVKVGAAIETDDGAVIAGCNVESPTAIFHLCAERAALVAAVAKGHRGFRRIATIGDFRSPLPPCGYCRQALLEFAPDIKVIMATTQGRTRQATLAELMPQAYRIADRADDKS
ncbi:MAG: cytidine deaminase [Deltaproteobacteria bacterium]|nr:cytidine deaminase [Deltaproteobacteria bacterium]